MNRIKHVFLDRDGTVIKNVPYLGDPAGVEILPGCGQALASLVRAGLDLFLVTNQSGIGRGLFTLEDLLACQDRLHELLAASGVVIKETAFCPHAPENDCQCRKPSLGMWHDLQAQYNLKPEECAMLGDSRADVLFGRQAGFARTILVLTGYGADTAASLGLPGLTGPWQAFDQPGPAWPDVLARDVPSGVDYLLSSE